MAAEIRTSLDARGPAATFATLLDRAEELRPTLERHSEEQEERGQLTEEVVDALHDAGVFGMCVPAELGGSELSGGESVRMVERISYADASSGWVLLATNACIAAAGAYLGDEAVAEMFAGPRTPVVAGQGTRPGKATPDGNGYRLSGGWSFGSGIKHAQWVHSGGLVEDTGEMRILVVPRSEVELSENWDVMGLRGTGSIDYTMEDVAVPAGFSHVGATTEPLRGGGGYTVGVIGFACAGHTGWALGVGRRLLDELQALAVGRVGRPGGMNEDGAFLLAFADAEAKLRAARALADEVWADVAETIAAGSPPSLRQHTLIRLALGHATWTAHEVGELVYAWAGTTALRRGTIQRFFRDLHAGTQHITSAPQVREACGRELAGLAPGEDWRFIALVGAA